MTNNAYNDGTDDYIIVKTSKAFAYCNGIDKLKPYEPESDFSEAIKGFKYIWWKNDKTKRMCSIKMSSIIKIKIRRDKKWQ